MTDRRKPPAPKTAKPTKPPEPAETPAVEGLSSSEADYLRWMEEIELDEENAADEGASKP